MLHEIIRFDFVMFKCHSSRCCRLCYIEWSCRAFCNNLLNTTFIWSPWGGVSIKLPGNMNTGGIQRPWSRKRAAKEKENLLSNCCHSKRCKIHHRELKEPLLGWKIRVSSKDGGSLNAFFYLKIIIYWKKYYSLRYLAWEYWICPKRSW